MPNIIVPGDERWNEAQRLLYPLYGRRVALSGWKQAAVSAVGCYTQGGKVLMLLRSGGTDQQTKWGLVGGLIRFAYLHEDERGDEDFLATLARETREETGMAVTHEWVEAHAEILTAAQRKNIDPGYQGDFSSLAIHFQLPMPGGVAVEDLKPTKEAAAFRMVGPDEADAMLAAGQIAFPWEVAALKKAVKLAA